MLIAPNSTVIFIPNINLNNRYDDTIHWDSLSAQTSWFMTKGNNGYRVDQNSYIRKERNSIRVQLSYSKLYKCNYMMFKNTDFENKWFYAFITKVDYVNNETTEVEFDIDVIQSWYWDMSIGKCFIERQHAYNDTIGASITAEPFNSGIDYVENSNEQVEIFNKLWHRKCNELSLVVATAIDGDQNDGGFYVPDGEFKYGIYSGLTYKTFDIIDVNGSTLVPSVNTNELNRANTFLRQLVENNLSDSVVCVFLFPREFCNANALLPNFPNVITYQLDKRYLLSGTLDGYTPKNNKLYTSPFNTLYCTTGNRNGMFYNPIFFNGTNMQFKINAQLSCKPSLTIRPLNYKMETSLDNAIAITEFPQCAYVISSFKQWCAQHSINTSVGIPLTAVGSMLGVFGGIATGNPLVAVGSAVAGATSITKTITNIMTEKTKGGIANNPEANNSIEFSNSQGGYHFHQYCYPSPILKIIDDYFTMYGYAVGELGEPRLKARSGWTYIKTRGADCHGLVPVDDIVKINNIFDNGIRFWTNGDNIGVYSGENTPLG